MNSNIFKPLVSIVFTSYNHVEFLKQALDGLVNQTYSNIEIIIIDDCSTDGSQEVLKEYQNTKNVKLILKEENSGSYVLASNFGATFAKGDYILFAQCDDFSETNQIELLIKSAEENLSCGVVFSSSNLVDEKGIVFSNDYAGREHKFKKLVDKTPIVPGEIMTKFLTFSCVLPNLSAALIKHDLFKKVNGLSDSFIVVSDWEFWLKLSELTNFYYIRTPLNNFRQHGTTIRSSVKMKIQIIEIEQMFLNHLDLNKFTDRQTLNFKIGFGAIWFSYFLENKKQWLKSFIEVNKSLKIKTPIIFLFLGFMKQLKEYYYRTIFMKSK